MSETERIAKTAVIGAGGFLGQYFFSSYRNIYPDCIGTVRHLSNNIHSSFDLLNPDIRSLRLAETGHSQAIILAGITKIDQCETNPEFTEKVNTHGTLELIRQLVEEGIKPIFTSSDYVFDGQTGKHKDNDITSPITAYGRQKAQIEETMKELCGGNYLIIRLSKVFSLDKGDETIFDEMARILSGGGTVKAASDQTFCPTLISDVYHAVTRIQEKKLNGTFNVCSPEIWTRYSMAVELAKAMKINPRSIQQISLDDLGLGYVRPKDTSMVAERLNQETQFGFVPIFHCIDKISKNWIMA